MSGEHSTEIWKAIPDYPGYEVSTEGRVRNWWKNRILKQQPDRKGYMRVQLPGKTRGKDGRMRKSFGVHCLVLLAFVGPPELGQMALHTENPDKSDNRLCNLRWGTKSENNGLDEVRHYGKHPCSSFTPDDVRTIRRRLAAGEIQREIAEDYGVHRSTITLINRGKNHAYIED